MDGPLSASRYQYNGRSRSRSRDRHFRRDHRHHSHSRENRRDGDNHANGHGSRHHHEKSHDQELAMAKNSNHGRFCDDKRDNCRDDYYGRDNGRYDSRGCGEFRNGRSRDQEFNRAKNSNHHGRFRDDRRDNRRDEYYGRDNGRDSRCGDFRGDRRKHLEYGHYGPPQDTYGGGGGGGGMKHGHCVPPPQDQYVSTRGVGFGNHHRHPPGPPPRPSQEFNSQGPSSRHLPVLKHGYRKALPDEKLNQLAEPTPNNEDPRGDDPTKRMTSKAQKGGNGRNTESFDPASTLARPDLRVWVGSKDKRMFEKKLKHDDVVIVPELFGNEDNWNLYYKLVEEMRTLQKENVKNSEWISWHEGAQLISKNPKGSPTFEKVIDRLCEYFNIRKTSIGTRFNWYRDSSDWKPFHHDSAAYNPQRAKTQNITVGVSFGARRELAFLRTTPQENGEKIKIYFPQTNNGVFSFGRDVNILWKHGLNALSEEEQDGKGRISIILWGLAGGIKEEDSSPILLGSDGQGPHAQKRNDRRGNNFHHGRR